MGGPKGLSRKGRVIPKKGRFIQKREGLSGKGKGRFRFFHWTTSVMGKQIKKTGHLKVIVELTFAYFFVKLLREKIRLKYNIYCVAALMLCNFVNNTETELFQP